MSEANSQPTSPTAPQYFVTPGYGDWLLENLHYRQAVRLGDSVQISGQGGWDERFTFPPDLADEIVRAFDNVEQTLALAGAGWQDVVSVESFHIPTEVDEIGEDHTAVMVREFGRRMGEHAPIWTQVGVAALGAPGMRVEIKVTAVVRDQDPPRVAPRTWGRGPHPVQERSIAETGPMG